MGYARSHQAAILFGDVRARIESRTTQPKRKHFYNIFIILTIACCLSSTQASPENNDLSTSIMTSYWNDWIDEHILPSLKVEELSSNGSQCFQELEKIFSDGGEKRNIILDATGKPSSGLLEGNLAWLGDYRQCVDTTGLHYCLISAPIHISDIAKRDSASLTVGTCVPEECKEKDIIDLVRLLRKAPVLPNVIGNIGSRCSDKMDPSNDSGFICTLIFLSLLCILCLCATAYESYWSLRNSSDEERIPILEDRPSEQICNSHVPEDYKELSPPARSFLCFSLTRSVNQITNTTSVKDDIRCLHGIRVISMFWIILGHSLSYQQKSGAMADSLWVYSVPAKWFTSQVIFNGYVALDTFFFMGGLLVAYTGIKYMSKSVGRVNWLAAIIHRYLRITPAMAVVILLYTFVYPYLGEGPFWFKRVEECQDCYQWWWTNFLYINNFVPAATTHGCLSWTWYLAADMQLFLVGVILIILLWWFPVIGIFALSMLSLASFVVRAVIFYTRDYAATQVINISSKSSMFVFSVKPYACATAYLIGIAMGYCLHISKNKRIMRLHMFAVLLGWLSAFAVGMSLVYGLYGAFDHPGPTVVPPDKAVNVVYGSLKSLAWSLALCWVVFSCHHGYGGVVNRFLSWRFWIPLSRLTFCAYLLHPAIIYLYTGTIAMISSTTIITQSILYAGFVTISYSAAFILSALIEMPICSLQKMFLKR